MIPPKNCINSCPALSSLPVLSDSPRSQHMYSLLGIFAKYLIKMAAKICVYLDTGCSKWLPILNCLAIGCSKWLPIQTFLGSDQTYDQLIKMAANPDTLWFRPDLIGCSKWLHILIYSNSTQQIKMSADKWVFTQCKQRVSAMQLSRQIQIYIYCQGRV